MGIVLLVRHGQASFGADDYDVLSNAGVTQGVTLGRALAESDNAPVRVISGSLRRQRETAENLAKAARWKVPFETDARWDELDHLKVVGTYAAAAGGIHQRDMTCVERAHGGNKRYLAPGGLQRRYGVAQIAYTTKDLHLP